MNKISTGTNYGLVVVFFILMLLYLRDELVHLTMLDMSAGEHGYSRYYIVGMLIVGLMYILPLQSSRATAIRLPKAARVFNFFVLLTYILSLLPIYSTRFDLLSDYIAKLLPVLALYVSYSLIQRAVDEEKVLIWVYVAAIFLGYFYVTTTLQKLSLILKEDTVNSSVYFLLYLLPLLLCTKRKMLKIAAIVIIGAFVVLSAKRGGFVAFVLGLVVYILVGFVLAQKIKFKHVFLALASFAALAYIFSILQNDESLFLFSRLEGIENYGAGDRAELYPKVFKMITNSDLFSMIWGHGYNSVIVYGTMGYSAHNDFLEIWYDFGLIGLSAYLALWYHLVRMGVLMIKNKSKYAAPYSLMLSILFVNSMVSHIYLFNQYLLMFSVTLSAMWSLYYKEKRSFGL